MLLSIKKCTAENLEQLIELSVSTFYEAFHERNTKETMEKYLRDAFSYEQMKSELFDTNSGFYFAYYQTNLVGYFKINTGDSQNEKFPEHTVELARFYIVKEFRNKKLGSEMLNIAIEMTRKTGAEFLWLGVWDRNPEAQKFYERHGFKKFGQHPFVMGEEVQTDYLMRFYF
jgi:diamine N-acetyltransferase